LESEESVEQKLDLKKLLAVVPPPHMLRSDKKQIKEKRVKLRFDESLDQDQAKISPQLARELGISEALEITVAGKKRFRFRAVVDSNIPPDVVFVNPERVKPQGVADNSMCTIRRAE